jgi:hypothetical protein
MYKRSKKPGPYFTEYVEGVRKVNRDPNFDCLSNYMCPPLKEVSRSRTPSPKTLRCEAEKEKRCKGRWTEKCYCTKTKKASLKSESSASSSSASSSSASSVNSRSLVSSRSSASSTSSKSSND